MTIRTCTVPHSDRWFLAKNDQKSGKKYSPNLQLFTELVFRQKLAFYAVSEQDRFPLQITSLSLIGETLFQNLIKLAQPPVVGRRHVITNSPDAKESPIPASSPKQPTCVFDSRPRPGTIEMEWRAGVCTSLRHSSPNRTKTVTM